MQSGSVGSKVLLIFVLASLLVGLVEWFVTVALPVILWWAWALMVAVLIAAPFAFGTYMRSPWGGGRDREGLRAQFLSLILLAVFLFDQSRRAGWLSVAEGLAFSIGISLAAFVVAVAIERAVQWMLRRVLRWVEWERAKGTKSESAAAGSAGDVSRALSVFGMSEPVKLDTLKARYRRLVVTVHPDKGGSAARFRDVQEAYEVLVRVAVR